MGALKCATILLAAIQSVHAWGILGHATVGYIAQNYVSPSTKLWLVKSHESSSQVIS